MIFNVYINYLILHFIISFKNNRIFYSMTISISSSATSNIVGVADMHDSHHTTVRY